MIRSIPKSANTRPGFTLMELMVSVAILLAVLALVGTIFGTASKAGGQATALTTVHRQLSEAAERVRQDLAAMDPASDVLGIAGSLVSNVRDSRKNDAATGNHRADTLMLFTRRGDARPYVSGLGTFDPNAYLTPTVQVVYGHANVGVAPGMTPPVRFIEGTPQIPAYDWHLARRTVFFPAGAAFGLNPLTASDFLTGVSDLSAQDVPGVDPGFFAYAGTSLLGAYFTNGAAGYRYLPPNAWLYFDGTRWYRPDGTGWVRTVANDSSSPYSVSPAFMTPSSVNYDSNSSLAKRLFYDETAAIGPRTVIDPSPPTGSPGRLANHFLPNCCDFRVEFTYDDPREVGSANLPQDLDPLNTATANTFSRPVNWQTVTAGNRLIWSHLSPDPASVSPLGATIQERTFPIRWPRALRITLKAFDAGGRLDEPVTYTLIHCWN